MTNTFTYEMPVEPTDVPAPKGGVRRVDLEGGKWIDIRSTGSQTDGRFLAWWDAELARVSKLDESDEKQAELLSLNAKLAKFIGDRVVNHSLTYAGSDEPLPQGYLLFWELQATEVFSLISMIQSPPRQIVRLQDPKPDVASTSG